MSFAFICICVCGICRNVIPLAIISNQIIMRACIILLIILLVYISNNIPLWLPLHKPPHPTSALPPPLCIWKGAPSPTHNFLPNCSSIPLHWGIKPQQDQWPPLPLLSDKAILRYICIWSHGSHPVHSLVNGLFPGTAGWSGQQKWRLGIDSQYLWLTPMSHKAKGRVVNRLKKRFWAAKELTERVESWSCKETVHTTDMRNCLKLF